MNESSKIADMLHTIALSVERETEQRSAPFVFSFVFGIGSAGLTPFEYELAGKKCGEEISISVPDEKISEYFGHILQRIPNLAKGKAISPLKMKIEKIEKTSPAELVRAMSDMIGGCGCGCGGHGHGSPECTDCNEGDCKLR